MRHARLRIRPVVGRSDIDQFPLCRRHLPSKSKTDEVILTEARHPRVTIALSHSRNRDEEGFKRTTEPRLCELSVGLKTERSSTQRRASLGFGRFAKISEGRKGARRPDTAQLPQLAQISADSEDVGCNPTQRRVKRIGGWRWLPERKLRFEVVYQSGSVETMFLDGRPVNSVGRALIGKYSPLCAVLTCNLRWSGTSETRGKLDALGVCS